MACGLARPREMPGHRRGCEAKLTLFSRFLAKGADKRSYVDDVLLAELPPPRAGISSP
jgi:hypothetical protein